LQDPWGCPIQRFITISRPSKIKIIKKKERIYFTFVKNTITEIVRSNNNAIDVNVATFALFGMLNWIYKWYNPDDKIKPEDLSKHILSIVLNGLKGDPFTKVSLKKPANWHPKK
jgi:hypothetical protein